MAAITLASECGLCDLAQLDTIGPALDAGQFRYFRRRLEEGSPVMQVRVFYHDKCFDGACSASLFTRFHQECITRDASYEYHGLVHRAGALFDESEFTGDENAIVDFKYSPSPRITWWFDHHQSAFLTPAGPREFSGLPARSGVRGAEVLRSQLHLVHQLSGAHRQDAVWIRYGACGGADSLGRHCGRREV